MATTYASAEFEQSWAPGPPQHRLRVSIDRYFRAECSLKGPEILDLGQQGLGVIRKHFFLAFRARKKKSERARGAVSTESQNRIIYLTAPPVL